jgi:hypothetical protein
VSTNRTQTRIRGFPTVNPFNIDRYDKLLSVHPSILGSSFCSIMGHIAVTILCN